MPPFQLDPTQGPPVAPIQNPLFNPDGSATKIAFRIRPEMRGFRKFFGRLAAFDNTAAPYTSVGSTFQDVFTVEQHFDSIQLVIGTIQTSGTTVRSAHYVNVCSDESLSDSALNALSGWQFANWDSNDGNSVHAQFSTFAQGANQPAYLISQRIPVNSVDRTDGRKCPLVVVRSHLYPVNSSPTVCGNGTTDVFTNVVRGDGRTMKTRVMAGNGLASFSGADASQTPLFGIIYWSRGRVVNIIKIGDSLDQDRNSPMGDGWVRRDAIARSDMNGIAYEVADFSWSGLPSANYHNIGMDALALVAAGTIPGNIACYPAASPNDIAGGASLATATANMNTARYRHQDFVSKAVRAGVVPLISTFAPVATSVNDYTLCDGARQAFNNYIRTLRGKGVLVVDRDRVLADSVVNGQVQPIAAAMLDGIHPNLVGSDKIAILEYKPALASIGLS